jgi:HPt (histidine-containing phosphotransfer) domain-containing protein
MTHAAPIEPYDFDALLELLDRDTMREVVTIFVGSVPGRISVARQGIAGGDFSAAVTAFHTMRSGSGQLGARTLESLCSDAERAAKVGDVEGALTLLDLVEAELALCLAWFHEHGWVNS